LAGRMSNSMIKAGVAAGAAYMGWRYLDERHGISSDFQMARRLLKAKADINRFWKEGYNAAEMWETALRMNPKKNCMLYEDEVLTYEDVEKRSNQMANYLLGRGVKRGDTIALLMENRPEFVLTWLGATKIGVKVALINTSIKMDPLLHCIRISECNMLIFGTELQEQVYDILGELENLGIMICGHGSEAVSFAELMTPAVDGSSTAAISPKHREGISMADVFGYIYTSGTTGKPKAAVILMAKMVAFGNLMANGFQVTQDDIIYTCLPLFHSAGGGLGVGMMMYTGATIVIKKKFSAKEFWKDCVRYNVTVAQYIGELCRYLLLQPKQPEEKQHKVRICIGNGLRPEIWEEFQTRFNVPEIGEFYGATEGNGALINHCTTPEARGTVGRLGTLLKKVTGMKFAKFDVVEEEPMRGPDGLCIECEDGEPGELLMVIKDDDPSTRFAGYNDKKATEKKIIRDAFEKGDKYFRTGDLLSRDSKGYVRFVDRIGDTFRWKGENCSTNEIAEVLSTFPGVEEINIYGVLVPNNQDGRAPMAAITPKDGDLSNLDLDGFLRHAKKNLPSYSVPLFLRILPQQAVTATLKLQKVQLRNEGIDLDVIRDPVYWHSQKTESYEVFTPEDLSLVSQQRAKI